MKLAEFVAKTYSTVSSEDQLDDKTEDGLMVS